MATTICFANQKGGVAKTTSCVNTAFALAEAGRRVLVVDMDPQTNATQGLGVQTSEGHPTVIDLLRALVKDRPEDPAAAVVAAGPVDVLPGSVELFGSDSEFTDLGKEHMLSEVLAPLRASYDYVLIDTPPNLGWNVVNALTATDLVVIPSSPTYWSNEAIVKLQRTIATVRRYSNPRIEVAGVLVTDAEQRTTSAKANIGLVQRIADKCGIEAFDVVIPHAVAVRDSVDAGRPLLARSPLSKPATAYRMFAEEIERKVA